MRTKLSKSKSFFWLVSFDIEYIMVVSCGVVVGKVKVCLQ